MINPPMHVYAFFHPADYYASKFSLPEPVAEAFLESLETHIRYVIEAGLMLGLSDLHLMRHDESKFGREEFAQYAINFHGGKSGLDVAHEAGKASDDFAGAWLHHIHHNPHHWQHWIFPDSFTPKGSSVEAGMLLMPELYVREMVADWLGASRAYTGSWDMTEWLRKNLPRVRLHSQSWMILKDILREDYGNILDELIANGLIP